LQAISHNYGWPVHLYLGRYRGRDEKWWTKTGQEDARLGRFGQMTNILTLTLSIAGSG